ncbi:hypothetical protein ARMSODRAFT_1020664 [Armillaria solidipes]|uniref:Uncharacterized protein n=1 Tax=Armillaria solidipes TaxID=1076256 RepID=A0A2H3B8H1_9AGAR|nr:hypothetical protein ARMSODRAFT_1020664 [Armillaria solidipes]
MSSVSPSSTSQISNDIDSGLCLALDTTWKTETYDTFAALSHFLEILESDELKTKYLLQRLSIEEFHAALESQHFPRTYSCEGFVLAVLEASGPPSYLVDYYQTIPSADGYIHSFAIARSCLQPAPYAAFIDSSFKHLVTFQTNRQVFLFKDHRDHLPASFERLPPLPIM